MNLMDGKEGSIQREKVERKGKKGLPEKGESRRGALSGSSIPDYTVLWC